MKKFYSKFRIGLMTFAFGLASVFAMNGSLQFSDEVQVNLPETESQSPIIVYQSNDLGNQVGGSCSGTHKKLKSEK